MTASLFRALRGHGPAPTVEIPLDGPLTPTADITLQALLLHLGKESSRKITISIPHHCFDAVRSSPHEVVLRPNDVAIGLFDLTLRRVPVRPAP